MDGPGHSLYFSVWIGEACGIIESSGIAQRWDLGGRRECPAGGLGVWQLNEWGPLHSIEVQEDEQDKENDEPRVGHGEGRVPRVNHLGDRNMFRAPQGSS